MTMSKRLSSYLDARGARYELREHHPSQTSAETARWADVDPHRLAKSVILEDDEGCVMAVVPADRMVRVGRIARLLGRAELHLADEERIDTLFDGCKRGAVPAVGMAWGLPTIVDEELEAIEEVFLEAGDHRHLLRLTHQAFDTLMADARRAPISVRSVH